MVFFEFMQPVSEFTLLFIGTVAVLDIFFAELRFLFMSEIARLHLAWRFLSGKRVASVFGKLKMIMG